jgi:protein TonB
MKLLLRVFPASVILSIFLHLAFLGAIHWSEQKSLLEKPEVVEISFINPKKEKELQIVQQDQRLNDKRPTKEAFLGKHDQAVDEQMIAAKSGKTKDTNGGGQFLPKQNKPKKKQAKKIAKNKDGLKKNWKKLKLDDLKPSFDWSPNTEQKNQAAFVGEESQSSDYLENVKKGNQNLLNTREFKYYTYFNRIRNQLQEYWEPSLHARLNKLLRSGRQIASTGPKTTRVLITLNNRGNLVGVQVLEDSGVRDLDEAAIEAFKQAAPFPNPPSGIVEKDGNVRIRWDFVLEA